MVIGKLEIKICLKRKHQWCLSAFMYFTLLIFCYDVHRAFVAQLDRVQVSEARGRGFDSRRAHHFYI